MRRLAIIGSASGGGAAQIIEALQHSMARDQLCILDNDQALIGKRIFEVLVKGSTREVHERYQDNEFDEAIIAIGGNLQERKRIFELLVSYNIPLPNVIDPTVRFGLNVTLGKGNVILNDCYVGNSVCLGDNNYVLNQCSIQHDTEIDSHNYLATNVTIGAKVKVGMLNRFGIKCIVETRAEIKDGENYEAGKIIKVQI